MHLDVELVIGERVEGSVRWEGAEDPATFSGWLELMRLMEFAATTTRGLQSSDDDTSGGGRDSE